MTEPALTRSTDYGDRWLHETSPAPTVEEPLPRWQGSVEWKDGTTQREKARLEQRCRTALAVNDAYIALAAPTSLEVQAQVETLTRQASALIRILLRQEVG